MPQLTFFIDAEGGTLAFQKEEDAAVFTNLHAGVGPATPARPQAGAILTDCIEVSAARSAAVMLWPTDPTATYTLRILVGSKTGPRGTGDPLAPNPSAALAVLDGYEGTGLVGAQTRSLSVFGWDWLWVEIEGLSAGTMDVDVGVHAYEVAP